MKKLLSIISVILCFVACEEHIVDNNEDNSPENNVIVADVKLDVSSVDFSAEGGSKTIGFSSTVDWTAEIINTRADDWCKINPEKGRAGNANITVSLEPNDTPDDRSASIIIKAGSVEKTVNVTQKQKDALTVTASRFDIPSTGGEFVVEIKTNVDFNYSISSGTEEWLQYLETRSLKSSALVFNALENTLVQRREAEIIISSGSLQEVVKVYQDGVVPTMIISQNEYVVSSESEIIDVEVRSNVDVRVEIPAGVDWVQQLVTRSMSTNTYQLLVSPNEMTDAREAEILFTNDENGLSETVRIIQAQKDALVLTQNQYELLVGKDPVYLDIPVLTNATLSIEISENAKDWLKHVATRTLIERTLVFEVLQCPDKDDNIGTITISAGDAVQTITVIQTNNQDVLDIEREALIAFYKATGGDNWVNNENWCSDNPVSTWYGIETDSFGHVLRLNFMFNNLTGVLPAEIGNLKELLSLNLYYENLSGELPEELFSLTNLQDLIIPGDFDKNHLSGKLPESIWKLEHLINLDLSGQEFIGEIPQSIANLKNLLYLNLSNNKFSGSLPDVWTDMTQLVRLSLGANYFTGEIPESFGSLYNLSVLDLAHNGFSGKIPESLMQLPVWSVSWLSILRQDQEKGGEICRDGIVISAPKVRVKNLDGEWVDGNYYSENEYTIILGYMENCPFSDILIPKLVTLYELYHDKGLDIISIAQECAMSETSMRNYIQRFGMKWRHHVIVGTDTQPCEDYVSYISGSPTVAVANKEGILEFFPPFDVYGDVCSFIGRMLGSIEEELYESTDYSADGNVTVLQKATVGYGIDIVLMGDAYTDRLIADGTYSKHMQKAYDALFSVEPYKSYRNMFNVYSVDVVSRNEVYAVEGAETALNTRLGVFEGAGLTEVWGDDAKVFEYASKVVSPERMDEVMVVTLMNVNTYAGQCYMYAPANEGDWGNGPSISYFPLGASDATLEQLLHHETLGHGFAKLADEYYNGTEKILDELAELISNDTKFLGYFKNVDFTDDPSQVRWARFLSDERYAGEDLGIFEGAYGWYRYGIYRPSQTSIMVDNIGDFNAPSREAIYYRLHKLAYGPDWEYDYEKFVEYDAINRRAASRTGSAAKANYVEKPVERTPPPVFVNKTWREAE